MTTPYVPEMDVVEYLAGVGSLGLTAGVNLYTGALLPANIDGREGGVPSLAVFVQAVGGPAPMPYFARSGSLYTYGIQINTRSNPDQQALGLVLARAVRAALHEATIPIAAGGYYVLCLVKESSPLYLGADSANRHRWSQNLDLRAVESP